MHRRKPCEQVYLLSSWEGAVVEKMLLWKMPLSTPVAVPFRALPLTGVITGTVIPLNGSSPGVSSVQYCVSEARVLGGEAHGSS